jgi:hypothetical protein
MGVSLMNMTVYWRQILTVALMLAVLNGLSVSATDNDEAGVIVEVGKWEVQSLGNYPGHENHQWQNLTFSLDTGLIRYRIKYAYCSDPSHAPNVATPEGYIGMPEPRWENWYGHGFLYIIVNDKDIGATKPTIIRKLEHGERGSMQVVWDRDDVQVRLTFLTFPKETALLAEVAVFPIAQDFKIPANRMPTIRLRLVAYPSAYTHQGERCVVTPLRSVTQVQSVEISPEKEWWLLYVDRKFDRAKGGKVGGCGAVFLSEEIAAGKIDVTTYPVVTELSCKPGVNRLHFAVWDFYDKTNAEAEDFIKADAHRVVKLLRTTDFSCRHLRKEEWNRLRADVTEMLIHAKGNPKLVEKVHALVKEIDEAHSRLAEYMSKGQPTPLGLEDTILAGIEKLEPLIWELRFEKLFADE